MMEFIWESIKSKQLVRKRQKMKLNEKDILLKANIS